MTIIPLLFFSFQLCIIYHDESKAETFSSAAAATLRCCIKLIMENEEEVEYQERKNKRQLKHKLLPVVN